MTDSYREQIEMLYTTMYRKLYLYANIILKNHALSEEAVQEVFQIACSKPNSLFRSKNPEGWLVITLKNVISNTLRSRASAEKLLNDYIKYEATQLLQTENLLDISLLYEDLAKTEEYQLIKEMILDGKSHLEMAQERGISVTACKKRVQRAKSVLKDKIK